MPELKRILDLVGQPVAGRFADIHSRYSDGTEHHAEINARDARRGTLIGPRELTKVYTKPEKRHDGTMQTWLRWEWKRDTSMMGDCGYSGVVLESHVADDFYILLDPITARAQRAGSEGGKATAAKLNKKQRVAAARRAGIASGAARARKAKEAKQ